MNKDKGLQVFVCFLISVITFLLLSGGFSLIFLSIPIVQFSKTSFCEVETRIPSLQYTLLPIETYYCILRVDNTTKIYYDKIFLDDGCPKNVDNFTCFCSNDYCYKLRFTLDKIVLVIVGCVTCLAAVFIILMFSLVVFINCFQDYKEKIKLKLKYFCCYLCCGKKLARKLLINKKGSRKRSKKKKRKTKKHKRKDNKRMDEFIQLDSEDDDK